MTDKNNEISEVLKVLRNMQVCIETGVERIGDFKMELVCGICFHVKENTKFKNLDKAFTDLGLHYNYPVEMQLCSDVDSADALFDGEAGESKYNKSTERGSLRIQLIDTLIKYYEQDLQES